jgi:hypothetical protein
MGPRKRRKWNHNRRQDNQILRVLSFVAFIVLALNLYTINQAYPEIDGQDGRFMTEQHQESIKITLNSLSDLNLELYRAGNGLSINATASITLEEASKGKEPLLKLLFDAGITYIDIQVIQLLPTWHQVEQLYGNKGPVIEGESQCESFRNSVATGGNKQHASLGIAGMFDSGTNLAATYLEANCKLPSVSTSSKDESSNYGIRWQVPWGKHVLAKKRKAHLVKSDHDSDSETVIEPSTVLPVVLIRDPYYWMQSLCRQNYGAQWLHNSTGHCPNLVPNEVDYKIYKFPLGTIPVRIKYDYGLEKWNSLAHLWSDWYRQYYQDADYPRLLVRYEDFLFYPKQTTQRICECMGGTLLRDPFYYAVGSAKYGPGHGSARTSWISGMIRYGSGVRRFHNLTEPDLALARHVLDEKLMETFRYAQPREATV